MFSSYFGRYHASYMPYCQYPEQISDIYQQQLHMQYHHETNRQHEHQDLEHQNYPQKQNHYSEKHLDATRRRMAGKCTDGNFDSEETKSEESKSQNSNMEIKFSIDRILSEDKTAETKQNLCVNEKGHKEDKQFQSDVRDMKFAQADQINEKIHFDWLCCTRYRPPKLQRMHKRDCSKKRKLGRNPRVPFTQHQVATLEQKFGRTHYLSSMDVGELSMALNLSDTRIKVWFQNRRAREKRSNNFKQTEAQDDIHSESQDSHVFYAPSSSAFAPALLLHNNALRKPRDATSFRDVLEEGPSAFTPVSGRHMNKT